MSQSTLSSEPKWMEKQLFQAVSFYLRLIRYIIKLNRCILVSTYMWGYKRMVMIYFQLLKY